MMLPAATDQLSERKAIITWKCGQVAILDVDGWEVVPFDLTLLRILNRDYNLARMQGRRSSTVPDLLSCAAKAAAIALGAEDLRLEA